MADSWMDFDAPAVMGGPAGEYRYLLTRTWDAALPPMVWVMLNPSTADATQNDATIRVILNRAMRDAYLGRRVVQFGRLVVVNLFALRSTDPTALSRHPAPIGPRNDAWIMGACQLPGATVVAAWGAAEAAVARGYAVSRMLADAEIPLYCLGITRKRMPRHPLRTRSLSPLQRYEAAA